MAILGWEGFYTLLIVVLGLAILFKDLAGPDFVFVGMLGMLLVTQVISLEEGLDGFSSSAPMTVAVLFVVASGISETGGLNHIFGRLLGRPTSTAAAMVRMMVPVAIVSAFMNNTPVVAIMIPIINSWSQKADLPPGQLFIPLSYASMLGGTCTLIGTSTNLVVAGLQKERQLGELSFFDISIYGVPVAIFGMIYMMLFAPLLLPGKENEQRSIASGSDFMVGLQVSSFSPVVGKSVEDAGLRGLDGLYLASVRRGNLTISAIGPEFVIAEHDILFFTGVMDNLKSLADSFNFYPLTHEHEEEVPALLGSPKKHPKSPLSIPGSSSPRMHQYNLESRPSLSMKSITPMNQLLHASIKQDAKIAGHTIRELAFRSKFDAAIVAVSRSGKRVHGKLGDIILQAKDVLVIDAANGFDETADIVRENLEDISRAGKQSDREFMVAMVVSRGGPLDNLSIESAGLRGLPQLFLVEIERETGKRIPAAGPEEVLYGGDVLWFAGVLESVASLRKIPGLTPHGNQVEKVKESKLERRLVQAVVSPHSRLVGYSVRDNRFRTRFNAAIIGVHRQGQRVKEKIGDIVLGGGDVLLLDTGLQFVEQHRNDRNFALVSEVENSAPPRFDRALISSLILVAMVASQLVGVALGREVVNLFVAAVLAAGLMLLFQCLGGDAARSSVKWDVIITIGAAFGISKAMENSHVAGNIANVLVSAGSALGGNFFVLIAVYLATMLLSNLVANNAVAALMFPIAAEIAEKNGIDFQRMSAILMLAASSAFMSPFGYQTNLMVYGAGGYTIKDFVKFGLPMQLWQLVISIIVVFTDDWWVYVWCLSVLAGFIVIVGIHVQLPFFGMRRHGKLKNGSKRTTANGQRNGRLEIEVC